MKLIVGLGNPGEKYELTRHNAGFEVIDLFRREICAKSNPWHHESSSLISEARLETQALEKLEQRVLGASAPREDLILAKPQTFMNSSGTAVSALASKYNVPMEDLYVIYDDIDLELGLLRIRRGGSAGGHKGVRSIIESLGSHSFPRLRIGIGQPPPEMDAIDYVLSRFSDQEREQIQQVEQIAVEALKTMILEGIDSAMNKFNARQKIVAGDD